MQLDARQIVSVSGSAAAGVTQAHAVLLIAKGRLILVQRKEDFEEEGVTDP